MAIFIFFLWLIGFGILIFGLNKSKNSYKVLYSEINKVDIKKDYKRIKHQLEKTKSLEEEKLLKKIPPLLMKCLKIFQ